MVLDFVARADDREFISRSVSISQQAGTLNALTLARTSSGDVAASAAPGPCMLQLRALDSA